MPLKSRTRGKRDVDQPVEKFDTCARAARVTMQPIGTPSRSLKLAIAFFARVTTGFWPVMAVISATVASIDFGILRRFAQRRR